MPCAWCGEWVAENHDTKWAVSLEYDWSTLPPTRFEWWWRFHKICYTARQSFRSIRALHKRGNASEFQLNTIQSLEITIGDVADLVFSEPEDER